MNIKRITYDALLSAMCVALGYFSLDLGAWKFTFENVPVIIGAMMFGPVDGALIGFIGIFLTQMLKYGIEISTPLWVLPYVVSGLLVGFVAKKNRFSMKPAGIVILMIVNGLVVTGVNTLCLFVYYRYIIQAPIQAVITKIPLRVAISLVKAVAYAVLIPLVIRGLEKARLYERPDSAGR